MRESEKLGPPWEVELIREGDKPVEAIIRATGDNKLTSDTVREASNMIISRLRPYEHRLSVPTTAPTLQALRAAHEAAEGKITPEYLAHLAVAYEEVVERGRPPFVATLARAIGGKPETVKGHVMKAREDGKYLTKPQPGKREGGTATPLARKLVAQFEHTTDSATINTSVSRGG
ncbi:hypothetical protein [Mycobacterium sp. C31M]